MYLGKYKINRVLLSRFTVKKFPERTFLSLFFFLLELPNPRQMLWRGRRCSSPAIKKGGRRVKDTVGGGGALGRPPIRSSADRSVSGGVSVGWLLAERARGARREAAADRGPPGRGRRPGPGTRAHPTASRRRGGRGGACGCRQQCTALQQRQPAGRGWGSVARRRSTTRRRGRRSGWGRGMGRGRGAASPGRGSEQNSSRVRSQGARPPARPDGGTHPSSSQRGGAARPSRAPQVARTWPASHAVLFARAYQPPASVTFFFFPNKTATSQQYVYLTTNQHHAPAKRTGSDGRAAAFACLPGRGGGMVRLRFSRRGQSTIIANPAC